MHHTIYLLHCLQRLKRGVAQKCFTAAVMHSPEHILVALSLSVSQTEQDYKVLKYATHYLKKKKLVISGNVSKRVFKRFFMN